jgi:hypothetical protein
VLEAAERVTDIYKPLAGFILCCFWILALVGFQTCLYKPNCRFVYTLFRRCRGDFVVFHESIAALSTHFSEGAVEILWFFTSPSPTGGGFVHPQRALHLTFLLICGRAGVPLGGPGLLVFAFVCQLSSVAPPRLAGSSVAVLPRVLVRSLRRSVCAGRFL